MSQRMVCVLPADKPAILLEVGIHTEFIYNGKKRSGVPELIESEPNPGCSPYMKFRLDNGEYRTIHYQNILPV